MKKQDSKELNSINIHPLNSLQVAFNEEEFLLVINVEDGNEKDGYFLTIPVNVMAEIVEGLYSSGLGYQKNFGNYIGFAEKEV